jgi:hypothetical protein
MNKSIAMLPQPLHGWARTGCKYIAKRVRKIVTAPPTVSLGLDAEEDRLQQVK